MGKKWLAFAFMVLMLISATRVQAVVWGTYVNWGLSTALSTSKPYAMVFYEQDDWDNTMTVWTTLAPNSDRFWLAKTEGSNEAEAFISDKTEYNANYERYFMGVTDYEFLDPNTAPKPNYYWAWVYWENTQNNVVDASNDLTIFFAQYDTDIDIINLANNVITVTVTVTDVNGDPVPGAEVYMDIDASSLDSILTNPSLDTELKTFIEMAMKDLLKTQIANYTSNKGVYWVTDNAGQVTFKVPKKVYEGVRAVGTTYKFTLTAKYTLENGTQYVTNSTVIDTLNGDTIVSLLLQEDIIGATGGGGQEYIYISFYSDDALTQPVHLSNYNISVIKAFSPDGLSSPATHTYEFENYYTLKIPVDTSYPYVVVSLTDAYNNLIFKKGYVMGAGVYSESLAGEKALVLVRVFDSSSNTYLQSFKVELNGGVTDYVANAVNGSVSLAVEKGTYVMNIYDSLGNLVYSTQLSITTSTLDYQVSVALGYIDYITFSFVDGELKPVHPSDVLKYFTLKLEAQGYAVDLGGSLAFKYSLDNDITNNKAHYYIYTQEERDLLSTGAYLSVYDKVTGEKLRTFKLNYPELKSFMIILPYSVGVGTYSDAPADTGEYFPPVQPSDFDKYTAEQFQTAFDWFLKGGLLFALITLGVVFAGAETLGTSGGIYMGLAMGLVFVVLGLIPKELGALMILGLGALLLRELNIHKTLTGGDE